MDNGFDYMGQFIIVLGGLGAMAPMFMYIGREIYWRRFAERVTGAVIGVRRRINAKGGLEYYAVYRYTTQGGETYEGMEPGGDTSKRHKETGREEKLLVFPDEPFSVRTSSSLALPVIFMLPGAIAVLVGIAQNPSSPLALAPVVLAGVVAARYAGYLSEPPGVDGVSPWRFRLWTDEPPGLRDVAVERIEDIRK